jgi:hypothetical protein
MPRTDDTTTTTGELVPVKFSRLTRRGLILGLSLSQMIALGIGGASLIGALYAGGGILIAYSAPIWAVAIALTWVKTGGRALVEWIPVCAWWAWRTTGGQLAYRRRIVAPRPEGTLALPGDMARLREYTDPETGAGMIHDPTANTLTVVVSVTHPAFVLLDPSEQHRRVTAWGRVLATICRSGRVATLQVLERTLPDSGQGLAEWWAEHGTHDTSWASTTYSELIDRAGPAGERHATTLSLSLDMKAAGRQIRTAGGGLKGAANVLRQEMTTLNSALRAADLTPSGWLSTGELAVMLRTAYDPAIGPTLERHGQLGQDLATAGPVAVAETWDRPAHRLRVPRRALDQRMAPRDGLSRVPRPGDVVDGDTAVDLADLHPAQNRPGRPRHPQEEGGIHQRPRPEGKDRPDPRRLPDRRVRGRAAPGSRPDRRARGAALHRPHRRHRPHR